MENFDEIEKLIEEVEIRPALYNKNLKEYTDTKLKKQLWEDVCEAVVYDWDELTGQEKVQRGIILQKKWGNLRSCFRRELNAQKNPKNNQTGWRRRQYLYFKKLLFLLPKESDTNSTEDDCDASKNDVDNVDVTLETKTAPRRKNFKSNAQYNEVDNLEVTFDATAVPRRRNSPTFKDVDKVEVAFDTAEILTRKSSSKLNSQFNDANEIILNSQQKIESDGDTNFALSIVPSLRELSRDEKLEAKIEILRVFKKIRQARVSHVTPRRQMSTNLFSRKRYVTLPVVTSPSHSHVPLTLNNPAILIPAIQTVEYKKKDEEKKDVKSGKLCCFTLQL
ncbi:hypothetical protein CHUAL_008769 [Chamberlinius hualienensis]